MNIRIPNALPYILSALKITATAAVVGAIVGEFVASQSGLGVVIVTTQTQPEHAGGLRRPGVDLRRGPRPVRSGRRGLALAGALGRRLQRILGGLPMNVSRSPSRLAAASLASDPALAQRTQKVVFALNWFAVGDHAAYWVALDKGYYKDKGLDVELQNSKGSADSIAKVDTGRADIGLADASVVIPRLAQGAKVKVVGAVFDNTPLNIWTRKDTGITRPKDLEGKTLAAPPGDAQRQLFPAFAKINGIDAATVKWLNIEPAAKFVALSEKRADAVPDYTTGQPFWEKAVGKDNLVRMPWYQYGFDTYSMAIFASDKTINERPRCSGTSSTPPTGDGGTSWRTPRPPSRSSRSACRRSTSRLIEPNMMLGLELMKTERFAKHGIGWMDRAKMCRTVELINTYMDVAPQGGMRRGVHERVPAEGRAAQDDAVTRTGPPGAAACSSTSTRSG